MVTPMSSSVDRRFQAYFSRAKLSVQVHVLPDVCYKPSMSRELSVGIALHQSAAALADEASLCMNACSMKSDSANL